MRAHRLLVSVAVVAAAAGGLAVAPTASAITPGVISAANSSIWQTNGPVDALAAVGGVLYVGGEFTSVRPPGAAVGTGEVARSGLAAFDAGTGALLTSFDPTLSTTSGAAAVVRELTVSPDGSTLYVGGSFAAVDSSPRTDLAAFDTGSGQLTGFSAAISGSTVYGIVATADTVYLGGAFSSVDAQSRANAAAVDAATGLTARSWNPTTDAAVRDLMLSPDQSEIVLAGLFTSVHGAPHRALMAVDPASGNPVAAWGAGPNLSRYYNVFHLAGDGNGLYVPGVDIGGRYGAEEFDGTAALNWSDGSVIWRDDCEGDSQAVAVLGGTLYVGSHSHDCSGAPGGFPPLRTRQHLTAERPSDGLILPWFPNTNVGPDHADEGPRVMATDGSQLFLGGDFTAVNGARQQGLTRFPSGPDRTRPTRPGQPKVFPVGSGQLQVRVVPSSDPDDGTLTYDVYRDGGSTPVTTLTADTRFWSLPEQTFTDTGLSPGPHSYTVVASDGTNRSATSPTSAPVDADASPGNYLALPAVKRGNVFYLRNGIGPDTAHRSLHFGNNGDVALWGDWDGDGTASAGVYRPSTATFYLADDTNTTAVAYPFGHRGDVPLVGDWNGDGTSTIGVYRPGTGTFYLSNDDHTAGPVRYGNSRGDLPLVGDWDGSGTDTVGVDRSGAFYLSNDNRVAAVSTRYGNAQGDHPVVGDWDGNGVDTLGIVRGNQWYLSNDNHVAAAGFTYGLSSDVPFTWSATTTAG